MKDMLSIVWQDKNLVRFLTTAHACNLDDVGEVERRRPRPYCQPIKYVLFSFAKRTGFFGPIGRRHVQLLPQGSSCSYMGGGSQEKADTAAPVD